MQNFRRDEPYAASALQVDEKVVQQGNWSEPGRNPNRCAQIAISSPLAKARLLTRLHHHPGLRPLRTQQRNEFKMVNWVHAAAIIALQWFN
jgi:hypothetical protein